MLYIARASRIHNECRRNPAHLLVVLGSGGHTAEMLAMLQGLNTSHFPHRSYVVGSGDAFSAEKAREFEETLLRKIPTNGETNSGLGTWDIYTVPRARQIHQSLLTTPWTCAQCLLGCLRLLLENPRFPDLIITNGPATALIVMLAAWIVKFFAFLPIGATKCTQGNDHTSETELMAMRTIYIESWARVKTPSLSLRIIRWTSLCDRVLVQHDLLAKAGWGECRSDLMR